MDEDEGKAGQKARACVERLLKIRPRSEEEIKAKLRQKKFAQDIIKETLDHYRTLKLLDDRSFARSWIVSRLNRPFGTQRIRYELIQKGVDPLIIKEELDKALIDHSEEEIVFALAQLRIAQYRRLEPLKARSRLTGFLSRRGFSPQAIQKAIKKLL
jgi:regulatory protein